MRLLIPIFLLLFALRLGAATGDITATIRPDGWSADITIEGVSFGGTYDFGLGANDDPSSGSPKMIFTATSLGYDTAGNATTVARTVYGKKRVRTPAGSVTIAGSFTSGTFTAGETITQTTSGATAIIVVENQSAGPRLMARAVTGTPDASNVWTGGTSGATFTPTGTPVTHGTASVPGPWEYYDGTSVRVRVALSHYVYQKDNTGAGNSGVAVNLNALSGFYTQGGTPNNAVIDLTTVNNSTQAYQKVVASWTWVPYQRITGNFTLRATAWAGAVPYGSTRGSQGIAAVKFSASDGTTTLEGTTTAPTILTDLADVVPIPEFNHTFSSSSLIQGSTVTANFIAYPIVGDSAAVFNTATSGLSPAALYGPQEHLCDRTGAYGVSYAVVDGTSGSDPAGVTLADDAGKWVGGGSDPGSGSGVTAYATIARAARAIRNRNNDVNSRDDVGAGIIFVKAGSYNWLGATISGTYGAVPKTWVTVQPFTGVSRSDVIISGISGNTDISDRVRIFNVLITASVNSVFAGIDHRWFDQVEWNSTANSPVASSGVWYVTHNKLTALSQGLRPSSTQNCPAILVRGNHFAGFSTSVLTYTAIGNFQNTKYVSGSRFIDRISGSTAPAGSPILAFNEIKGWEVSGSAIAINFGAVDVNINGVVVAQNLIECTVNATAGLGTMYASAQADGAFVDNAIFWNNVLVGQRMQFGYNSSGSVINHRRHWSVQGNYWDIPGCKTDTFTTANGNRVGNWPVVWGVNAEGNVSGNVDEIASPGFDFEQIGLSSIDTPTANDPPYPEFVDPQRYDGTAKPGLGDYHLGATSPLRNLLRTWVLSHDLEGDVRGATDSTGAYTTFAAATGITVHGTTANQVHGVAVSGVNQP